MLQATLTTIGDAYTFRNRDREHIAIRGDASNGKGLAGLTLVEIRMTRDEAKRVIHELQEWLNG